MHVLLAVIGGAPLGTAVDPVVALASDAGEVFCSGVVVAPEWVLTAAHCLTLAEQLEAPVVAFDADLRDGADRTLPWVEAVRHPDADEVTHADDLALLRLEAEAPVGVWGLHDGLPEVGEDVAIYGFGASVEGQPADGVKRGAVLAVESVDADVFRSFSAEAFACSGDSGGPALIDRDGSWVVAGIDTFVDPACLGGRTGTTLLDLDWIRSVADGVALGPPAAEGPAALQSERGCSSAGAAPARWLAFVVGVARLRRSRRRAKTRA